MARFIISHIPSKITEKNFQATELEIDTNMDIRPILIIRGVKECNGKEVKDFEQFVDQLNVPSKK